MEIPNKFKLRQFSDPCDDKYSPSVLAFGKDLGLPEAVAPISFTVFNDEGKEALYTYQSRLIDEGVTFAWTYETKELGFPQNLSILN